MMGFNRKLAVVALVLASLLFANRRASAQTQGRVVRLAELEIDPAQLDRYRAELRKEIEAAVRMEPGVLALYAVSVKDHPEQIRLFEMYATQADYQSHLQTPHFKRYKAETSGMVRSLKLVETDQILLRAK
jgi:quinol monooxygenase YgiN